MKKLVITGGHHNSALVVAELFQQAGYEVHWFGHRHASHDDLSDSAEYQEVKSAGIKFYDLHAGKLGRAVSVGDLLRIPGGIITAYKYLRLIRPVGVLSFGGYLGFAASVAGYLLGISVYLHEQTVIAGKSNRLVGLIARRIFLTWDSSRPYFPHAKTVVVGLPLRRSILKASKIKYFHNSLPTLVVMGGKQGSHLINQFIFTHINVLLKRYNILHQTGTNLVTGDYKQAELVKSQLPKSEQAKYRPVGYIGHEEIGTILRSADLYLGRSGAHIVYELCVLALPSVLIPYPHTHKQEQLLNAKLLTRYGVGTILPEKDLRLQNLLTAMLRAENLPLHTPSLPRDAAKKIVKSISSDIEA